MIKFFKKNISKLNKLCFLFNFLIFTTLFSNNVFAASLSGPFSPPDTDLSKKIFIDFIFGPLTTGQVSPLSPILKIFNGAILILAGMMVTYTLIWGTVQTAHDGEVLGKKWSAVTIPIRTVAGAALLMPVLKGSFCIMQWLVLYLALQGVGLADLMWTAYAQNPISTAGYVPPALNQQARATVYQLIKGNICVDSANEQIALQKDPTTGNSLFTPKGSVFGITTLDTSTNKVIATTTIGSLVGGVLTDYAALGDLAWYDLATNPLATSNVQQQPGGYGFAFGDASNLKLCGAVYVKQPPGTGATNYKLSTFYGLNSSNTSKDLQTQTQASQVLINLSAVDTTIYNTQKSALFDAQISAQAIAKAYIAAEYKNNNLPAQSATLNSLYAAAVFNYANSLTVAASQAAQNSLNQNTVKSMSQDGWLTAGAYYMQISDAIDQVNKTIMNYPQNNTQANLPNSYFGQVLSDGVLKDLNNMASILPIGSSQPHSGLISVSDAKNNQTAAASAGQIDPSSNAQKLIGWFMNQGDQGASGLTPQALSMDAFSNPVIMMKNLGNKMVVIGWSAVGLAMGLSFTPLSVISSFFGTLASTLIGTGAALSVYLPMVPFILWIGAFLGWLILLVEAVVAAPLWAFAHIAPDADGVVGKAGQGYMLILSLMIRPALMIFGLVCAISLMQPLAFFLNTVFLPAFNLNALVSTSDGWGGGGIGLTAMIAGSVLYTIVMYQAVSRIFALIYIIPDKVLAWIGGPQGAELGESARTIEGESHNRMLAGVGATVGLTSSVQQGVAQGRANILASKQNDLAKKQLAVQEQTAQQAKLSEDALNKSSKHEDSTATARGSDSAIAQARSNFNSEVSKSPKEYSTEATKNAHQSYVSALRDGSANHAQAAKSEADSMVASALATGRTPDPVAADFSKGYTEAQSQGSGALKSFLNQQGEAASKARASGEPINDIQKHLANSFEQSQERGRIEQAGIPPQPAAPVQGDLFPENK